MNPLAPGDLTIVDFLWGGLLRPLLRLLLVMSLSLTLAQVLESLRWTEALARVTSPLLRIARLGRVSASSFALAFFSPAAANALLAEAVQSGTLSRRELVLANLFNSTPAFLVHLPSLLAVAFAFLGPHAAVYVGLTLLAAALRTAGTAVAGHFLLPPLAAPPRIEERKSPPSWSEALAKALKRVRKRLRKMIVFTVPVYCLIVLLQRWGVFAQAESYMAGHALLSSFLRPQALGVIALCLMAETSAAMAAAAALLHGGALSADEVVFALLVGNILSSPMRAFRHQFPSYAGYFSPVVALQLVGVSQAMRVLSLLLVTTGLYAWMR